MGIQDRDYYWEKIKELEDEAKGQHQHKPTHTWSTPTRGRYRRRMTWRQKVIATAIAGIATAAIAVGVRYIGVQHILNSVDAQLAKIQNRVAAKPQPQPIQPTATASAKPADATCRYWTLKYRETLDENDRIMMKAACN